MNRRLIAVTTAVALLAATFVGTQAVAASADAAPATADSAPQPADASAAQDESTASSIAATYDHTVIVTGEMTPTQQVTANPDGTMTLDSSTAPVRVKQNGTWQPTNLTLKSSGGWVVPDTTAVPVRFSAGGSSVMAEVQTDTGEWVTESWPGGTLPVPVLSDDTATYDNVLPGVDLRLTATSTGMAEVLVVEDAAAATNPSLADLELKMPNATVSVDTTQSTVATAPDDSTVTSAPPTWWDSSTKGASATGPGGAGEPQPLPHSTDGDSVNLDVAAVAAQKPTYPLYVDPDWNATAQDYWFTDRAYPSQSYLNGNQAAGYQSVGWASQGGVTYLSRAFWQFGVSALAGKLIESATVNISVSYSCAATPIQLWTYGPSTPGFTWNTDPGAWGTNLSSVTPASASGCAVSDTYGLTATSAVASAASASKSTMQFGIRAADESGDITSRKHLGYVAKLEVTYDTRPNTPTDLTIKTPSRACGTSSSTSAWVNNKAQGVVLQASQSDDDGTNLTTEFQVFHATNLGASPVEDHTTVISAEGPVTYTIPQNALAEGDYAYRAKTLDQQTSSVWTGYCYFTVANTPPPLPTLTLSTSNPTVGTQVTATFTTTDANVRGFVTWITPGILPTDEADSPVDVVTTGSTYHDCAPAATGETYLCSVNNTASLTYTISDSTAAIYVAALDRAGNISNGTGSDGNATVSASKPVMANLDPRVALPNGHAWLGDGSTSTVLPDLGTSTSNGMSAPTPLSLGTAATPDPLTTPLGGTRPALNNGPQSATDLYFSGTPSGGTPATTGTAVVDQTQSFSVSAWLAPSSTAGTSTNTAVAQPGASGPAYSLQQIGSTWQFCLKSQNTGLQQCVSTASGTAHAGAWTFVTGIWDISSTASPQTGQMSIVLNGNIEDPSNVTASRTPVTGDTPATGPLVVGAAATSGTTPWLGDIVDVAVFPGVPSTHQLGAIAGYGDPNHP